MSRLSVRIYLAFVAVVLLFFAAATTLWWGFDHGGPGRSLETGAAVLELLLPPAGAPAAELRGKLERIASATGLDLLVQAADGDVLATTDASLPLPRRDRHDHHWLRGRGRRAAALVLADGRVAVVSQPRETGGAFHGLGLLAVMALALGAGAWPVARSITRRLERVSRSVESLGSGRLDARAPVEGRDEVARLARSFNHTADRIEALVSSQRTLLASASHELRSPLARLRVAAELLTDDDASALAPARRAELRERIAADVARLDAAVEELLVASRLDLIDATADGTPVDLLALVVEEAAVHADAVRVEPPPAPLAPIEGDARSLRHLVRNLLANALEHAPGSTVDAVVSAREGGGAVLCVADRGPGIAPGDRERIFEAFTKLDGTSSGLGLGLALVRRIARHHGGDARAEARTGGGTRIVVELVGRGAPLASASN